MHILALMVRRIFLFCLFLCASITRAGPPFITDDPQPVPYRHWEFYLASAYNRENGVLSGSTPQIEANYGIFPDTQLHVVAPYGFVAVPGMKRIYGYGDTELGVKYRFIHETDIIPQIGTFPLAEVPSDSRTVETIGSNHTRYFLPLWLQKSFGGWTAYGGGGYWFNPGPFNKNWWYTGLVIQKQVFKNLALGGEIFHTTPTFEGDQSQIRMNFGFIWDLNERYHIMATAGPIIHGPTGFQSYVALQISL